MIETLCIIPARYNPRSDRFPGKVLKKIHGKPMLQHVVERCSQSIMVDKVVVATHAHSNNKPLLEWLQENKVPHVALELPEEQVLFRVCAVAAMNPSKYVVRVNGDSPMILPQLIDKAVMRLKQLQAKKKGPDIDYVGYRFNGDTPSVLTKYAAPEVFTSNQLRLWSTIPEHITSAAYAGGIPDWIDLDGKPFCTVVDTPEDLAAVTFRMEEQCNSTDEP